MRVRMKFLLTWMLLLAVTTTYADKVKKKRFVEFENSLGSRMVSLVPPEMTIHQFPDYDTDKLFDSTNENLFKMPKDFNIDTYNINKKEKKSKTKDITFTKEIKVPIIKPYKVPVIKTFKFPITQPVPYHVDKPYPIYVKKFVQVPVYKPVPYPVIKHVPFKIPVPVEVPIETRVPVPIEKPVPYHVRIPVKVPVPDPYHVYKQVPINLTQDKFNNQHY